MTHIPDETLHAHLDNRLPPERHAEVTAWLHAQPDVAARVAGWKRDADTLRSAFSEPGIFPPNPNLSPAHIRTRQREKRRARMALAASVIFALALGGTLGWHGHALQTPHAAKPMSDALTAYRLFAGQDPALEFTATERTQLQHWMHHHIGDSAAIPELTAQGWHLNGGRWLSTPEGAAVMLVYQDSKGARVGLYMRPKIPHHSTTGERQDGELLAHYWLQDNIAIALIGPAAHNPVKRMAEALQTPG